MLDELTTRLSFKYEEVDKIVSKNLGRNIKYIDRKHYEHFMPGLDPNEVFTSEAISKSGLSLSFFDCDKRENDLP